MTTEEVEKLQSLLEKAASDLAEHFDSVRIFASTVQQEGSGDERCTDGFDTGRGNFYAQLGQVQEWLNMQEQYHRNHATRNEDKD